MDQGLVLANEIDGPTHPSDLRQRSSLLLPKKAGLPGLPFHDLLCTCTSLLFSKNVHPEFVQEPLGHAEVDSDVVRALRPRIEREEPEWVERVKGEWESFRDVKSSTFWAERCRYRRRWRAYWTCTSEES